MDEEHLRRLDDVGDVVGRLERILDAQALVLGPAVSLRLRRKRGEREERERRERERERRERGERWGGRRREQARRPTDKDIESRKAAPTLEILLMAWPACTDTTA